MVGIEKYLGSGLLKGIELKFARHENLQDLRQRQRQSRTGEPVPPYGRQSLLRHAWNGRETADLVRAETIALRLPYPARRDAGSDAHAKLYN